MKTIGRKNLLELTDGRLPAEPFALFRQWYNTARQVMGDRADAMVLSTCSGGGGPSSRVVLLKEINKDGFIFYTHYGSRKASDLAENPRASLLFYWPELERQVRVEGTAKKVPREKSETYFATRPRGSQIAAWASMQSRIVPNRKVLEARFAELEKKFAPGPVPLPPFWGGYCVVPEVVEFWRSRPNRLHDRIRYTRSDTGWRRERLYP